MARDKLIKEIERLAREARGNKETLAAAGVLYSLNGAILDGTDRELLDCTAEHSRRTLEVTNMVGDFISRT